MVGRIDGAGGVIGKSERGFPREHEVDKQPVRDLARLIETEVIPRMMFAHGSASPGTRPVDTVPGERDVARLLGHILRDSDEAVFDCVDALIARRVPLERIFLGLLGPVARRLGEMWEADTCSFTEVTLGLMRLQQVLRRYAPRFNGGQDGADGTRRLLLNPLPGEQHNFGIFMVAEFFRRAGWVVDESPCDSSRDITTTVAEEWYAVVGLSLSAESRLNELANLILELRERSANPDLGIMVGGWLFSARPELVEFVGADIGGRDAARAVDEADYLLGQMRAMRP